MLFASRSFGTEETVSKKMGMEIDCKPTAVGLGYPVISTKNGHQGSFNNLLRLLSRRKRRAFDNAQSQRSGNARHTACVYLDDGVRSHRAFG